MAAFTISTLRAAIGECLGFGLDGKLALAFEALEGMAPDDETAISFAQAGRLLALLLQPDTVTSGDGNPGLRGAVLEAHGRRVALSADVAHQHALIGPWVGSDLADSIARLLAASADLSTLAHAAPDDWQWILTGHEDAPCAGLRLLFAHVPQLSISVSYGPPPTAMAISTTRCINGANIAAVGALARDLATPAPSGSPIEAHQTTVAAAEAARAVIH